MKTVITLLTSAVFACITTFDGQAAEFTNTTPVQLLNSTYYYDFWQSADLKNGSSVVSTETDKQSATTNHPFSESMTLEQSTFHSEASGNAFSLSVYSKSTPVVDGFGYWYGYGYAFTSGTWQFQSMTNDNISFFGFNHPSFWSAGYIVLTDLTTDQEVLNVEDTSHLKNFINTHLADKWKGTDETEINYNPFANGNYSPFVMDEAMISGHIYQLDIGVLAQSSSDSWDGRITANLTAVPLPLPIWLFATGLIFLGKWRSRT